MGDELCAAASLPLGKQHPPAPPPAFAGWFSGPVRMFLEKRIFLSLPGVEQWFVFRPTCSGHYTEWAIQNEPKVQSDYGVSCFFNPDILSCRWILRQSLRRSIHYWPLWGSRVRIDTASRSSAILGDRNCSHEHHLSRRCWRGTQISELVCTK